MNAMRQPITVAESIQEKLRQLREYREQYANQHAHNAALLDEVRENNSRSFENEAYLLDTVRKLEGEIRADAVTAYQCNPEIGKKPYPGIGIRVHITKTPIYDNAVALQWAREHDICLQLDATAFEMLCETNTCPEFVVIEEETKVSATIATDLSRVIEEGL